MATSINSCYFKENDILETFEEFIKDLFAKDEAKTLFPNVDFSFSTEYDYVADSVSLPAIFITIDDAVNDNGNSNSSQIQQYTRFSVSFEIFTKELNDLSLQKSSTAISEYIIKNFQLKFGCMILTQNKRLPNIDMTVARRIVTFSGKINNQTNQIYSI